MHYGRMRSAPRTDTASAARQPQPASRPLLDVVCESRGPSVSCARDIDVTMTSRLLMLVMLTALTSCTAADYSVDGIGKSTGIHARRPASILDNLFLIFSYWQVRGICLRKAIKSSVVPYETNIYILVVIIKNTNPNKIHKKTQKTKNTDCKTPFRISICYIISYSYMNHVIVGLISIACYFKNTIMPN